MEPTPMIPWYQSQIIQQQILAFCVSAFALLKTVGWIAPDAVFDFEGTITAVLAFVAVLIPVWTIVTRALKPTPPITDTAKAKLVEITPKLAAEERVREEAK